MARLCFDYGHGGSDPGACYKGRKESFEVLNIGREVAKDIRRHGVVVDEIRTSDTTISLRSRSNFENRNKYDYFISFHRNAYEAEKAKGVETYTYIKTSKKAQAMANEIQTALVRIGFINRGVKRDNFHVLRETKAPALLIELGFIDNTKDNELFDSKRNEIKKVISKAILSQLGISYKEEVNDKPGNLQTLYRVMSGSYSNRANAENQVNKLKASGFDATIMIFNK